MNRKESTLLKRLFSVALSLGMCVNQIPLHVFAEDLSESAEIQGIEEDADVTVIGGEDNDDLFTGFVDQAFGGLLDSHMYEIKNAEAINAAHTNAGKLTGLNLTIYQFLAQKISEVAAGALTNTVFSLPVEETGIQIGYTASELGVDAIVVDNAIAQDAIDAINAKFAYDLSAILSALRSDYPYELFWYDKTVGTSGTIPRKTASNSTGEYVLSVTGAITISMPVSSDYSLTGEKGTYDLNDVVSKVQTAATNARNVVDTYAASGDFEKLEAYKNEICALTSYNDAAADDSIDTPYGDPWQLIWVFDNDASTGVVCEGYSKAFKYLCDLSSFNSRKVKSYIATGVMAGGSGEGRHMWNIVHMEDDRNYLVDVTNCDEGTIGNPDYLFMKGYASRETITASEKDSDGNPVAYETYKYTYNTKGNPITYYFSMDSDSLYTDQEQTLSSENYVPGQVAVDNGPDSMAFTAESYELEYGDTWNIMDHLTYEPSDADIGSLTFTVSDDNVLKLYDDGEQPIMLNAIGGGEATITAETSNGTSASAVFTVYRYADSLETIGDTYVGMAVGETKTFECAIHTNDDAEVYGEEISWSVYSGDTGCVSLDENTGEVTALYNGEVTIRATSKKGCFAEYIIHVYTELQSITFNESFYEISVGEEWFTQGAFTVTPEDAEYDIVSFTSDNTDVATAEGDRVVGVSPGVATVTLTTNNGKTASTEIRVNRYADELRPVGDTYVRMTIGSTRFFECELYTSDGSECVGDSITWEITSDENNCISLNQETGEVTALSAGDAQICALSKNVQTLYYDIHVYTQPLNISFDDTNYEMYYGESWAVTDKLVFEPAEAEYSIESITSSNPTVISIDSESIIASGRGTATVEVVFEGGATASAEFHVTRYADYIRKPDEEYVRIKVGESKQLEYILEPEGQEFDDVISWNLDWDDNECITLDENGVITANNCGRASVTAQSNNSSTNYYIIVYTLPEGLYFSCEQNYIGLNSIRGVWSYLTANIAEANECPLTVTSSNTDAIEVHGTNLVPKGKGDTTITVEAENGVKASATFTVGDYADSIGRDSWTYIYLKPGESKQLDYILYPEGGSFTDEVITWSIGGGDDNCIELDQTGKVTAKENGNAYVVARLVNGIEISYNIYVYPDPTGISFRNAENYARYLSGGMDIWNYLQIESDETGNARCPVTIISNNEDAVYVDGPNIIFNNPGTAEITVTTENGKTATATFTVGSFADYIAATDDNNSVVLKAGETHTFGYYFITNDGGECPGEEVVWSIESMTNDCVSIDAATGEITALAAGDATIRATIKNRNFAEFYVHVPVNLESLTLNESDQLMQVGDYWSIRSYLKAEPENAEYEIVSITSSNPDVISADIEYFIAHKSGVSTITVVTDNGITATKEFMVARFADGINIVGDDYITLRIGDSRQLEYELVTNDGSEILGEKVTWNIGSMTNDCISLDENTGEVTALASGDADIYANTVNGHQIAYHVHVYTETSGVSFDSANYEMSYGETWPIRDRLIIEPSDAEYYEIESITSSNTGVISIDGENIYASGRGTATVEVALDNDLTASAEFHVTRYADNIRKPDEEYVHIKVGENRQLEYILEPEGEEFDDVISWNLDWADNECITLDENGVITANNYGRASVTAYSNNSSTNYYIVAYELPGEINFHREQNYIGLSSIRAIWDYLGTDTGESMYCSLAITSSNTNAIEVHGTNLVPKGKGDTTITVEAENGVKASATFTVGDYADSIGSVVWTDIYLKPGESKQLDYVLYPEGGSFADEVITWSVEWQSYDEDCIELDQTGKVTAIDNGKAYEQAGVAAKLKNGQRVDYNIYIYNDPTGISFNHSENYARYNSGGMAIWNYLQVEPEENFRCPITITSSNEDAVAVNRDSIIFNNAGTSEVTVTTENGLSATATFTVGAYANGIELIGEQNKTLKVGETGTFEYRLIIWDDGDYSAEEVVWSIESMTNDCISIDSATGEITALAAGDAVIRATVKNGQWMTYYVHVPVNLESLILNESDQPMQIGESWYIRDHWVVEPENAEFEIISITSSNPEIISVDGENLNALGSGISTITVETDSGITVSKEFRTVRYADGINFVGDSDIQMKPGESRKLEYELYTNDGTDVYGDVVSWSVTENDNVASFDESTQTVTALNGGDINITATTINGYSITYYIHVFVEMTSISFTQETYDLMFGEQTSIWDYITIEPVYTDNQIVSVVSDGSAIEITEENEIKAVNGGVATVTVTTDNDLSASAEFRVYRYADEFLPVGDTAVSMRIGESRQFEYELRTNDGTDLYGENVTWYIGSMSNECISLDENTGTVAALANGDAEIIATTNNGLQLTYYIHVYTEASGIAFDSANYEMSYGESWSIWDRLVIEPTDAEYYAIESITSSNPDVITIDEDNNIVASGRGTATVEVALDNDLTASAEFHVTRYADNIRKPDEEYVRIKVGENRQLEYILEPEGEEFDDVISWNLDWADNECITLDENGLVTANNYGRASVTAYSNNSSTNYYIVAYELPGEINFHREQNYIGLSSIRAIWDYLGTDTGESMYCSLTITSSNTDAIEVYGTNLVPKGKGDTTITVEAENGVKASATFTVGDYADNIGKVDWTDVYLKPGESKQLDYVLYPEGGSFTDEVITWSAEWSTPEGCIELDQTGKVTALGNGNAYVIGRSVNGSEVSYNIYVYTDPTGISFRNSENYIRHNSGSYEIWGYLQIDEDETGRCPVTITSSNEDAVGVDGSYIVFNNSGTSEVTVTTENGKTATATFTVGSYANEIAIVGDQNKALKVGETGTFEYRIVVWDDGEYSEEEVVWSIYYMTNDCISIDAATGEITALAPGNATVRATIKAGNWATYYVHVPVNLESLILNEADQPMQIGESWDIRDHLTAEPENAEYEIVSVTSSNPEVISADNDYLYALKGGVSTITVETGDGITASKEFIVARYADEFNPVGDTYAALRIGETKQFEYELLTNDGTELYGEKVTWSIGSISNECISLDENTGLITALANGDADIYATTVLGIQLAYQVHIYTEASGVSFDNTSYEMSYGDTWSVRDGLVIEPADAEYYEIESITSSNPDVISIDGDIIIASGSGMATVEVMLDNGLTASAEFHVTRYADYIRKPDEEYVYIKVGESKQLEYILEPEGEKFDDVVSWNLDWTNNDCITLDENGVITANNYGRASVTAYSNNGSGVNYYIIVYTLPDTISFSNENNELQLNGVYDIWSYLVIDPSEASECPLTITSSRPDVVEVSGTNLVVRSAGETTITVEAENGVTASAIFKVCDCADAIGREPWDSIYLKAGESKQLDYVLYPEGGSFVDEVITWNVEWQSNAGDWIEVDQTGKVTTKAIENACEQAMVTATIRNGSNIQYSIYIYNDPTEITFRNSENYARYNSGRTEVWNYLQMEDADNYRCKVTITSTNEDVVAVDGYYITFNNSGTSEITVTTENGLSATATFTVGPYADRIEQLGEQNKTLTVGETCTFEYTIGAWDGGEYLEEEPVWEIEYMANDCISIDSATGEITALAPGYATVNARLKTYNGASYYVQVIPAIESISFNPAYTDLTYGDVTEIEYRLLPEPANATFEVATVTSSNPDIISVDGTILSAVGRGTSTIEVVLTNGMSASAEYRVYRYAEGISRADYETIYLKLGESRQLEYILEPAGETFDDIVRWMVDWKSSECFTLDSDGVITATDEVGSGGVHALTANGDAVIYDIQVYEEPTTIEFKQPQNYMAAEGSAYIRDYLEYSNWNSYQCPLKVTSSKPEIISVDGYYLQPNAKGTAVITVETANGLVASADFTVGNYAQYISRENDQTIRIPLGGQTKLEYTLYPEDGDTSDEVVTWSIEYANNDCITVDQNGVVKAVRADSARVKAEIMNGSYVSYDIEVYVEPTSLKFRNEKNYLTDDGGGYYITNFLECEPYGSANCDFTIECDNPDVIEVNGRLLVGLQKGTANITVTAPNGLKTTAEFTVGSYASWIQGSNERIILKPKEEKQLTYTLMPEGNTFEDEKVTWSVDGNGSQYVTVDQTGKVTATEKTGYATVRATITDGSYTTYQIYVVTDPQMIQFTADRLYMPVAGYDREIWHDLNYYPEESRYVPLTVTSSNKGVIEVRDNLYLQPKGAGETVITVKTENGLETSATYTVGNYADYISTEGMQITSLRLNESVQLNYRLVSHNDGSTADETVTWYLSSNPDKCITMSPSGYVTATNYGTAVVKLVTTSGQTADYIIHVVREPQRISFEKNEYYVTYGSSTELNLNTLPAGSENCKYVFTSSNPDVAYTADANLNHVYVYGLKNGSTTIRAESPYDSTVYAECRVITYTPVAPTAIHTESSVTGYKGYAVRIPVSFDPVTANKNYTVTTDNANVSVGYKNDGYFTLNCDEIGSSTVTVTASNGMSADIAVEITEGAPEFESKYTITHTNTSNYTTDFAENPSTYTCVVGETYDFTVQYSSNIYEVTLKDQINVLDALRDVGWSSIAASGTAYATGYIVMGARAIPMKAGTFELELVKGKKVLITVVDHLIASNEVKVSEAVEQTVAESLSEAISQNEDSFGMTEAITNAVASAEIPEDSVLTSDEKVVVESYLDVNVTDCSFEDDGSAKLAVSIEPMYKLKAVDEITTGERDLTEPQKMEINEQVTVRIPVGNAFEGKTVQTVLIEHTKSDGRKFTYVGTYEDGYVTFINPNGFSDFEIKVSEDVFGEPEYEWTETETGYTVTARVRSTTSDRVIEEQVEAVVSEEYEANCTQPGIRIYDAVFKNQMFTQQRKQVVTAEATGHEYAFKEWIWAKDYSSAEALFICSHDGSHTMSVAAEISVGTVEADCETDGLITYRATAVYEGETYTDVQKAVIPALGHDYVYADIWNWAEDYSTAEAVFTCSREESHSTTIEAEIKVETVEATCETAGRITYTATVTYEGETYFDIKEVQIPALGHTYKFEKWVWNEDLSEAYAVFVCTVCGSEQNVQAEITTTEEGGQIVYTATVNFEGKTYTDVRKTDVKVTEIKVTPETLNLVEGTTSQLTAEVMPENAFNKEIIWQSEDESIAAVDENGLVTAVSEGTVKIKAVSAENQNIYAECTVTVAAEPITVDSGSLALEGTLKVNFKVYVPEDQIEETYFLMKLASDTGEGLKVSALSGYLDEQGRRVYQCPIASTQMNEKITLTAEDAEGNPVTMVTGSGRDVTAGLEYSASTYLKNRIPKTTDTAEKALLEATDNYGKYAQIYFDYGTLSGNPTEIVLTDEEKAELEDYATSKTGSAEGVTMKSATLECRSVTDIHVYFTLGAGAEISNYTFAVDGKAAVAEWNPDKAAYRISAKDIASNALQKKHVFTIKKNGASAGVTVTYGALSYVYSKVNKPDSEAMENLAKSIYRYNKAAVAKFGAAN